MDCTKTGTSDLHYFPEFAQIHVLWASDGIEPSHPLSLPSPVAFNFSQNQGLFQWVGSSHQLVKVFVLQLKHQYFIQGLFPLECLVWSPCNPWDSQKSSPAPQFENINSLSLSLLYGPTLTSIHDYWKKSQLWLHRPLLAKWCLFLLMPRLCLS